jgi:NAD(P)-dependent dehydrogenase (short-subunit alcohol dehydrogenase family)
MHSVNVKGAWLTAKHGVQAMLDSPSKGRGGSIVFVASVAST